MVRFYTLIFAAFVTVSALTPEAANRIKTELADGKITSKGTFMLSLIDGSPPFLMN